MSGEEWRVKTDPRTRKPNKTREHVCMLCVCVCVCVCARWYNVVLLIGSTQTSDITAVLIYVGRSTTAFPMICNSTKVKILLLYYSSSVLIIPSYSSNTTYSNQHHHPLHFEIRTNHSSTLDLSMIATIYPLSLLNPNVHKYF